MLWRVDGAQKTTKQSRSMGRLRRLFRMWREIAETGLRPDQLTAEINRAQEITEWASE
jgi:hypothetical protein